MSTKIPEKVLVARDSNDARALKLFAQKAAKTRSMYLAIKKAQKELREEELRREFEKRDKEANFHICPLDD